MAVRLGTAARNASIDAIVDLLDAGAGEPTMEVRTGAQPTNVGDADTGTLLATFTLDATAAFGNAATGTASGNGLPITVTGAATGTAGHVRVKDGNGVVVLDGDAGVTSSGAFAEFNTLEISNGLDVTLNSLTLTQPI